MRARRPGGRERGRPAPARAPTSRLRRRLAPGAVIASGLLLLAMALAAWAGAGYPLAYRFARAQIPAHDGVAAVPGAIGGLRSVLELSARGGCARGTCGTFVASVSGIPAGVRARFGQLRGPFACQGGRCALTVGSASGIFSKARPGALLSVSTGRPAEGTIETGLVSRADWVATVARAAAAMKAEGILAGPASVTELVTQAASNEARTGGSEDPSGGPPSDPGKGSGQAPGQAGGQGNGDQGGGPSAGGPGGGRTGARGRDAQGSGGSHGEPGGGHSGGGNGGDRGGHGDGER